MKKWLAVLLLVTFQSARASYDYTGLIEMVYSGPDYNGLVFVQVASGTCGVPSFSPYVLRLRIEWCACCAAVTDW